MVPVDQNNILPGISFEGKLSPVPAVLLSLLLLAVPLIPDVQVARPKLLVFQLGLIGVFMLWIICGLLQSRLPVRRLLLFAPLSAFAVASILWYLHAPDPLFAAVELTRILFSVLAFLVAAYTITGPRSRIVVLGGWFSGACLAAVYGVLQYTGGAGVLQVPNFDRVPSTFGNPIFFAAYLVVTFPLAFAAALSAKNIVLRLAFGLAAATMPAALVLTQTRAAYLGVGVAAGVFALLSARRTLHRWGIALLLVVSSAAVFLLTQPLWAREQGHILIWRDTIALWLERPWTGWGLGSFATTFPQFASAEVKALWPEGMFIVKDAHNEYLQILAETGIVGLGLFLWIIVAFFKTAGAVLARTTAADRWLVRGCIAGTAGLLTQNFYSVDIRFAVSSLLLFFLMGLVTTFQDEGVVMEKFAPLTRIAGIGAACVAAYVLYPQLVRPYHAERAVASLPDFFEERVLEPARTIDDLEALARKYPDQAPVFEKLAWVYAKEKKWPQAIRNYEAAIRLNPDAAGPLNNLGDIHFLLGNSSQAIDCWQRSLRLRPQQVDSRLNLATAFYYQGNLKEASLQLHEVLKISPRNEKALVMLRQIQE